MLGFLHARAGIDVTVLEKHADFFRDFRGDARRYPSFHLHTETAVTGLILEGDVVRGLHAAGTTGPIDVRADLVIGAGGRSSTVRAAASLTVREIGSPMDVLWMRVSRRSGDPEAVLGRVDFGKMMVMIDRGDYWQCAFVIPKGAYDAIQNTGIEAFRAQIAELVPWVSDRLAELRDWNDVKLLTVAVDRLQQWYRPGLLCLGDAAHAMSPIGGVGINLAVQDAVAAANVLCPAFALGAPGVAELRAIQRRRAFPMAVIQGLQVAVQNGFLGGVLRAGANAMKPPLALRIFAAIPPCGASQAT